MADHLFIGEHLGFILATCFDATGQRLYSASVEGEVGVWDLATGTRLATWPCHQGPIQCLTYDWELISAGHDGSVGVWNPKDGSLIRRLQGHEGGVHSVASSGSILASASTDMSIALWDRLTGTLVGRLEGHQEAVTSVAFVDSRILVSGSRDCTVRLWDLENQRQVGVLEGHEWWVTRVGALPGGKIVSASEDGTLRVWDRHSGELEWEFSELQGPIWGMAVHPSGSHVLLGGDAWLHVDTRTHVALNAGRQSARGVSISSDGQQLALGADDGDIRLMNTTDFQISHTLRGNPARLLSGIAGRGFSVRSRIDGVVEVQERDQSGREADAVAAATLSDAHKFFVYATRQLTDRRFATGAFDGAVRVWDLGSGPGSKPVLKLDLAHHGLVFSLSANDDRSRLLSGGSDRLLLWDLDGGGLVWQATDVGIGTHLVGAINATGDVVSAVGEEPFAQIWSLADESIRHWPLPEPHSCVIEAIPGEPGVVVGSASGRVRVLNLDTGAVDLLHSEHEDWIRTVRVSADGVRVASVSQNGSGRVFDRRLKKIVERFSRCSVVVADFDSSGTLSWIDSLGVIHS